MLRYLLIGLLAVSLYAADLTSVMLASGEWPPYLSANLPDYGFVSRIVTEAFAAEGISVKYEFLPWGRAYQETARGTLDASPIWGMSPERAEQFLISDPVIDEKIVLFTNRTRPVHWKKIADLADVKLGATIGYSYGNEFESLEKQGVLKVERVRDDETNLRKLALGRIDAFPCDVEVGLFLLAMRLHDVAANVTYDPSFVASVPNYLLVSRHTPYARELLTRFNAGLATLRASGRLDRIVREGQAALTAITPSP